MTVADEVNEHLKKLLDEAAPTHRRKIGEVRERHCCVQPGFYQIAPGHRGRPEPDRKEELIEVSAKDTLLVRVERLDYEYPQLRENAGWQLQGWREPTPEELKAHYTGLAVKTKLAMTLRGSSSKPVKPVSVRPLRWWQRLWERLCHPFRPRYKIPPARTVEDIEHGVGWS